MLPGPLTPAPRLLNVRTTTPTGPAGFSISTTGCWCLRHSTSLWLLSSHSQPSIRMAMQPTVHQLWSPFALSPTVSAEQFLMSLLRCRNFSSLNSFQHPSLHTATGLLLPAAIVNALASGLVFYKYDIMFVDDETVIRSATDLASTFGVLALVWLDLIANRQPYYASYHGLWGGLFCWGYILFTIICYCCDITDSQGHRCVRMYSHQRLFHLRLQRILLSAAMKSFCVFDSRYIYPYLAWGVPLRGGGSVSGAKLLLLNLFLLTPLFNFFYWFLVWARRRVQISTKRIDLSI